MNEKSRRFAYLSLEAWILLFFTAFYICFCNSFMLELPHLTWFDFCGLITPYKEGTLKIADLFTRYGEHGMFGYNLIFLLNIKLFGLKTMVDVYINDINVFLCGVIIVYQIIKTVPKKNVLYYGGIVSVCLYICSATQLSSGAMETQVRLGCLFVLIVFVVYNHQSRKNNISKLSLIGMEICILLALNVFGTIYTFAGIPLLFILACYNAIVRNRKRKYNVTVAISCVISTILYLIEYNMISLNGSPKSIGAFFWLSHPIETIKAIIGYNGEAALGSALYMSNPEKNSNIYLQIGFIVSIIIVYAIIRYFKSEMYKDTYVPLLLISYSFWVAVLVLIGRADADWRWMLNEWYSVHSKFQMAAVIWILMYDYNFKDRIIKIINVLSIVGVLIIGIYGNKTHLQRNPDVANYYKEKQQYLFYERDEMPVDESGNTPLLADLETTMNSIEILKHYRLSVYGKQDIEYYWKGRLADNLS